MSTRKWILFANWLATLGLLLASCASAAAPSPQTTAKPSATPEAALQENLASALVTKGVRLGALNRLGDAIASLCDAWRLREWLPGGEALIGQAMRRLGKNPGECH